MNLREQLIRDYYRDKDKIGVPNPRFNAAYFLIKYGDRALKHLHSPSRFFNWIEGYGTQTWCWVDAAIHPIKKGDLLAAYHRNGAVVISRPEVIAQLQPDSKCLLSFCIASTDWPIDQPSYYCYYPEKP